jgi:hypothetical protein
LPSTTLAEHRATLRSLGNFPADDTQITDAVLNREINRALRRIAMRHDWPWLMEERTLILVGDVRSYPLPDDFLRLISVRDTDSGHTLSLRGIVEVDQHEGHSNGRSSIYAVQGNRLVVAATPSAQATCKIRYVAQENTLVNDTDIARIPDYFMDGLYDAVLVQLFRIVKQLDEAGLAEGRFEVWVTENQDNIRQTRESPRIRVRPGSFI